MMGSDDRIYEILVQSAKYRLDLEHFHEPE